MQFLLAKKQASIQDMDNTHMTVGLSSSPHMCYHPLPLPEINRAGDRVSHLQLCSLVIVAQYNKTNARTAVLLEKMDHLVNWEKCNHYMCPCFLTSVCTIDGLPASS